MKLTLSNGTELEVDKVVESLQSNNLVETKDGLVLEICFTADTNLSLEEIQALFTKDACEVMHCVTNSSNDEYVGYTDVLSIARISSDESSCKNIRLRHAVS